MKKVYPVVLYPPKIRKFLAPKLYVKHFFTNSNKKYVYILLFGGIVISFVYLRPIWLVLAIWNVILLSLFVLHTNFNSQNKTTQNNSNTDISSLGRCLERERQLKKLLLGSAMISIGTGTAQRGVSEESFKQVLEQYFPKMSQQGLKFKIDGFSIPYTADFSLIHPCGLSIDIEIDEPYVAQTKEPHHCLDQAKDAIRNNFFLSGNWIVIRFSEKQVVLYPQSCCKTIASVLAFVAKDYTYLSKLQQVPDLPIDPMWTTATAQKWAFENYRQSYLKQGTS